MPICDIQGSRLLVKLLINNDFIAMVAFFSDSSFMLNIIQGWSSRLIKLPLVCAHWLSNESLLSFVLASFQSFVARCCLL